MEMTPEELDYMTRMSKSMINDFFHGPETLKTERFLRFLRKDPMPQEEWDRKIKQWEDKNKEIWDGYTEL